MHSPPSFRMPRRSRSVPPGVVRLLRTGLAGAGMTRHAALEWLAAVCQRLRDRPLYSLGLGLLSGSILARHLALSPLLIAAMVLASAVCALPWRSRQVRRCWRLLLLGCVLTHVHGLWIGRALPSTHLARVLEAAPGRPVALEGVLEGPLERQGDRQRLYVQVQRLQSPAGWQPVTGRARLSVRATALALHPGDILHVSRVRLYPPRGFWNPGAFDWRREMYWRRLVGFGGVSKPQSIRVLGRAPGWQMARRLDQWRQELHARVRLAFPAPYAAVFRAMILGTPGDVPADMQQAFRTTGTAHLLVVSGLHVGFVAAACLGGWRWVLRVLRGWLPSARLPGWRPTPWAIGLSLPLLLGYCSLVGWKVPTTRAALMIGSSLLALALQRTHDIPYALVLAGSVLVGFDPGAIHTVGFQLSFAAVACILLASRSVEAAHGTPSVLYRWRRRLQGYLAINCAAFLGTLPILAATFHTVPTFGIVANMLLIPLAGVLVPAGVLVLVCLVVWPPLGALVSVPLTWLLAAMTTLTQAIAHWPLAQLHVAAPSALMIVAAYILVLGLYLPAWRRWRLWLVCGCLLVLVGGSTWQYVATRARQLEVTFLDVGSGDAILVRAPGNRTLLIDGGGTYDGRFDIGASVIAPVLWNHYVRRLDLMAMTHPQTNHARGLVSLARLFPVSHLLTNGSPLTAGYLQELMTAVQRSGAEHHTAPQGPRQWRWGAMQLTVLAPPALLAAHRTTWAPANENDRSLVVRLQYGAVRFLFTGDIEQAAERWLVEQHEELRADILQIPHHGSKTSSSPPFIRHVQPRVGVISLGAGSAYGHPHPRVLRTLAAAQVEVYRTDVHGAVTIFSDGQDYRIVPFRAYRPPR